MKVRGLLSAMVVAAALGVSAASAAGVQDLVRETQRTSESGGQVTMVWWLPLQFWDESMKANAAMPAEARTTVLNGLADYTVIAMLRAKAALGGLTDVQSKEEIVKNARVEVNGTVLEPLAQDKISPIAQLMLAQLKPALAGMAGAVGGAMEFVVYPAKSADGKVLVDAMQNGTLKVKLYENNYSWRLPLGSLLPARVDQKSGEEFPGNYQFNPFTGDKLIVR
jgi:hypothetical protein